jgi:hypothetical protein
MDYSTRRRRGALAPLREWNAEIAVTMSALVVTLALAIALAGCAPLQFTPLVGSVSGKSVTIPATIRHGADNATLVIINLTIKGKGSYPFALDTGASITLIESSLAQSLGLPVTGAQEVITGVGGEQHITPVSVSNWSLGAASLPARTIASADMSAIHRSAGVDGLLGSDVLSSFSAVTIDYASSVVTVTS